MIEAGVLLSAGPWITSFCSTWFGYNVDEKIKTSILLLGHCLCGVGTFFPCLRGFALAPQRPPTTQRCACHTDWCVYIVQVWMSVGVCLSVPCNGIVSWFPPCALNCWDRLWPPVTLNCSQRLENDLHLLIFLKVIYSAHLLQRLILDESWVFI